MVEYQTTLKDLEKQQKITKNKTKQIHVNGKKAYFIFFLSLIGFFILTFILTQILKYDSQECSTSECNQVDIITTYSTWSPYQPIKRGSKTVSLNKIDRELIYKGIATVITNLTPLPIAFKAYEREHIAAAFVGFSTMFTSAMYHLGETLNARLWFMNPGQWHRLDNVFVVLVFVELVLLYSGYDLKTEEILRWTSIVTCLTLQENNPWSVTNTILPVIPVVLMLVYRVIFMRRHIPPFSQSKFLCGFIILFVGMIFFTLALDEDDDYLRLKHGAWHLFSGMSFYFFVDALPQTVRFLKHSVTNPVKSE